MERQPAPELDFPRSRNAAPTPATQTEPHSATGEHRQGATDPDESSGFDWKLIPFAFGSAVVYFVVYLVMRHGYAWMRLRSEGEPVEDVPERATRLLDAAARPIV
jgi:hypothetical protein